MKKYLHNPNLPRQRVGGILVDYRIHYTAEQSLRHLGIQVYKTIPCQSLPKEICGHADMVLHHLGDSLFITAPDVMEYYQHLLPDAQILSGYTVLNKHYPEDIAYNIARIGKYAFHKLQHTDLSIAAYFQQNDVRIINVSQGYTKCSICIISETAAITSDTIIARKMRESDIDVLHIRPGFIKLPGYHYGFIGGAAGLIDQHILAVNGDITQHPDYCKIYDFCKKYDVQIYSLHNGEIEDIGSLIPLFYR